MEDLAKARFIVHGGNWIGLHPLSEVVQDDKHTLAFACFIVEHGAAFSLFYVNLMIHGHEITKGFGVFQGYLFGSSVRAGPGLLHVSLIANRTQRIFRNMREWIVRFLKWF